MSAESFLPISLSRASLLCFLFLRLSFSSLLSHFLSLYLRRVRLRPRASIIFLLLLSPRAIPSAMERSLLLPAVTFPLVLSTVINLESHVVSLSGLSLCPARSTVRRASRLYFCTRLLFTHADPVPRVSFFSISLNPYFPEDSLVLPPFSLFLFPCRSSLPAPRSARASQLFTRFLSRSRKLLFTRRPRRRPVSLVLIRYSLPTPCSHPAKSQTRLGRANLRPLYSVIPSAVSLFAPLTCRRASASSPALFLTRYPVIIRHVDGDGE